MLKKSINSANINPDSRKRNFNFEWLSEKRTSPRSGAVRSLRLRTFFRTFASLFKIEYATVRLSRICTDPGFCE
jgi:hypothetical protein